MIAYDRSTLLTVRDTTSEETHDSKAAVKYTVGHVGERNVLGTTSAEVGYGAEHADGTETCNAWFTKCIAQ